MLCSHYWCKLQMCKFLCIVQGGQVNNCNTVSTADLFCKCGAFARCLPGHRDCVTTTCTWPLDVPNGAVFPHSSHLCVKCKPWLDQLTNTGDIFDSCISGKLDKRPLYAQVHHPHDIMWHVCQIYQWWECSFWEESRKNCLTHECHSPDVWQWKAKSVLQM